MSLEDELELALESSIQAAKAHGYFPAKESLQPNKWGIINRLILNAQVITLARGKGCFEENCKENKFLYMNQNIFY